MSRLALSAILALGLALLLSACSGGGQLFPSPAPSRSPRPFATGNPRANLPAVGFTGICSADGNGSAACRNAELVNLLDAHVLEGLQVPKWPESFWRLPYDEQLFILADEERVDRNLAPVLGITGRADRSSRPGALHDRDPVARFSAQPQLLAWASNWASDLGTVAAEFDWMYNDGVSTVRDQGNLDCPRSGAKGCWGHRENTLIQFPSAGPRTALVFGGACVRDRQDSSNLSCGEIFELLARAPRSYLFTWTQALRMGA